MVESGIPGDDFSLSFCLVVWGVVFWGAILVRVREFASVGDCRCECLLFAGSIGGVKEIVLAFPLGLSLAGLIVEIYRLAKPSS